MHELIQKLRELGWKINTSDTTFILPNSIRERYPRLPVEIAEILSGVDECVSPDDQSWLLCLPDYRGDSASEYAWNEFEIQSLLSSEGENDWQSDIVNFWNNHFPIFISVSNGYEYAAISLKETTYGKVVSGREPEYEETTQLADNLNDFVVKLMNKDPNQGV